MEHTVSLKQNHEFPPAVPEGEERGLPLFRRLLPEDRPAPEPAGHHHPASSWATPSSATVSRRRIRELYRTNEGRLSPGYDIVVVARTRAVFARYGELERSFLFLMKKAGCAGRRGGPAVKGVLLALIRFYQRAISPTRPPCCRFIPTCSQYALEAVEKYGAVKGGWLALRRVLRCHPFHRQKSVEYDPVP